jgi:hypothetical protein
VAAALSAVRRVAFLIALASSITALVTPSRAHSGSRVADSVRATTERRAVEAAIWGMPIVAFDAMRRAFLRDAGAKYNDIVFWSKQADWKFQVTTPNASTWYVYIAINTKDGPQVIEIPPAIGAGLFGSMNDAWQVPMADIGPEGEDKGRGGKYLVLPPGYTATIPAGYMPVRFSTYNGYSILRAIPVTTSEQDVAKALALVQKTRAYPLGQAENPPSQRFIDMAGKLFDGIATFDDRFYDSLAQMVNDEPVKARDLVAMGQLKSIGIEKGKEFKPDAATRQILKQAIAKAQAGFMQFMTTLPSFAPGSRWSVPGTPVGPATGFTFLRENAIELDERAALFFFGCAPPKQLGAATFYLLGSKDAGGAWLDGGNAYRLRVPPNVPARQFWAVTVYDLKTAGFMREAPRVELNSFQEMEKNADGSVDVYFGPTAPEGKDTNWVYTAPGAQWVSIFRFYGPEKAVFDKTWVLPDIERVSGAQTARAQVPSIRSGVVPVTPDNFRRAESDMYFATSAKEAGGVGKLLHRRGVVDVQHQPVVRANRDTLYSSGVFDLDAGPLTVTMPDTGGRFMSMQVINEDHYVVAHVLYDAGRYIFDKEKVGTRYVLIAMRTLVDPNNPDDLRQAHAAQDAIKIDQKGHGTLEFPNWDQASQKKVRDALLMLNETLTDSRRMFGARNEVDPVRHLIGTAMGWGGNPERDALYLPITPASNDGSTVHGLAINDVPVDAFWSITVYNREGYLQPNPYNAYSLNNITAHKNADGSITVQFGGCDGKVPNCLPTVKGWNYLVRLYRPRPEVLSGKWTFPRAEPMQAGASRALQ